MSENTSLHSKQMYYVLNKEEKISIHMRDNVNISPFELGIPLLDLSNKTIEEIYYFRWHTYCKHIKSTPDGYVVTEFLPPVPWAGIYNTINCPAGHHLYEGRWFHDQRFLTEYTKFWFTDAAEPRKYSFWAADAVLAVSKITGDYTTAESLYEQLKSNFSAWEKENGTNFGLYYQTDNLDGMEYSAGGSGLRPTINSYMYADAMAISKIATRLHKSEEADFYNQKALSIKENMDKMLWDPEAEFYKTRAKHLKYEIAPVRELIGYVPWYFNLPDEDKSIAWKFLNDAQYFYAPYGPTTTEQNYPEFMKEFDHECLWNGPSWPFATSQTLTALGNLLNNYQQEVMTKSDYYTLLSSYANCHYLTEKGNTVPFIDENLDPFTGEWLARKIMEEKPHLNTVPGRGEDYNHSTFCDLVLSGLAGVRASDAQLLEVNPLFSADDLEYFCADGIFYHGYAICILWDKNGERYHKGKGFYIYCNGTEVYHSSLLSKASIILK